VAQELNSDQSQYAVPLLSTLHLTEGTVSSAANVLRVVLHALPLPGANTPWEAISEWRSDEAAGRKFRRLRHWINSTIRRNALSYDLVDELATLIDDYETYMALQHQHFRKGTTEIIATTSLEFIEDVVKFKPSQLISKLFDISRDEVRLIEAELRAPGREVAYISAARERFRR
jgi:hypothetical protein